MAIVMTEKVESRTWVVSDNASIEFVYTLTGTSDDVVAKDYALANTSSSYNNLPRLSTEVTPIDPDTNTGTGRWEIVVRYGLLSTPGEGDNVFSFDTGGGTQHITQSLQSISRTGLSGAGNPPSANGAIGVTSDSVDGVDIVVPVYQWAETHYFAVLDVDAAYKGILFNLTAKTNDAPFKDFAANEVLFLGAQGARSSDTLWEISFRFAASMNKLTPFDVGGITVPEKLGWEYLWMRYAPLYDSSAKTSSHRPFAAYVERVYDDGDFSGLNIGE